MESELSKEMSPPGPVSALYPHGWSIYQDIVANARLHVKFSKALEFR